MTPLSYRRWRQRKAAAHNSEDLNVVASPEVAEAYAAHWQARQAVSVRFADAADWCER